jgi:hypothetical protein
MRKLSLVSLVVSLVVVAVPAAAPAKGKNAAKECKSLRSQMGADSFRAAFGSKQGKNALGRCVSAQRKASKAARKRARKACKAKGLRGKAMKSCVRVTLAEQPAPKPADYEDAVKECEGEKAEDAEDFATEFGDGANAFSKCVADEVGDDDEGDEPSEDDGVEDSPGDEPEPDEL